MTLTGCLAWLKLGSSLLHAFFGDLVGTARSMNVLAETVVAVVALHGVHGQRGPRAQTRVVTPAGAHGREFAQFELLPVLIAGSLAVRAMRQRIGCRRDRGRRVVMAASPRMQTKLLVDADSHGIELLRDANSLLKRNSQEVHTTVFAPPGRTDNKRWAEFLQEPGISFQPVSRSRRHSREPNDEAIVKAMYQLSRRSDIDCIALLTHDAGYIDTLTQLSAVTGSASFVVLLPEDKVSLISRYQDKGIEVLKLKTINKDTHSRVRATLHGDGTGSVQLTDPYEGVESLQVSEAVRSFLADLGYARSGVTGTDYLAPACAKFWYVNELGSLTVFPRQLSTLAVQEVMAQSTSDGWARYRGEMAFFLPMSSLSKITKTGRQTYGNKTARGIFRGGGPFLLQDSGQLLSLALERLHYLDNDLNADEAEAILCFVNAGANTTLLRKMDLLPHLSDNGNNVKQKLRAAFLSHTHSGMWITLRKQENMIVDILMKAGFLSKSDRNLSRHQLFDVMKLYSEWKQLPPMKTFNGRAFRILRANERNPNKRTVIEIPSPVARSCPVSRASNLHARMQKRAQLGIGWSSSGTQKAQFRP